MEGSYYFRHRFFDEITQTHHDLCGYWDCVYMAMLEYFLLFFLSLYKKFQLQLCLGIQNFLLVLETWKTQNPPLDKSMLG